MFANDLPDHRLAIRVIFCDAGHEDALIFHRVGHAKFDELSQIAGLDELSAYGGDELPQSTDPRE